RKFNAMEQIHSRVTVRLKDGREFSREATSCKGMPPNLFTREDYRRRLMFAARGNEQAAGTLFDRLERLEHQSSFPVILYQATTNEREPIMSEAPHAAKAVDSIQQALVDYASKFRYEDLSPEAVHAAKVRVIDTLGCLIGAFFGEPARASRVLAAQQPNPRGST